MINPLILPSPDRDERPFVAYVVLCLVLFILNGIYDATINTTFESQSDDKNGATTQENMTVSDTSLLVLQNGETDEFEVSLDSNYSADGWVLIRIEALVQYSETTAADTACDTVSVELSLANGGGDAPQNSIENGQANDCNDIMLWMDWPSVMDSDADTVYPTAPLTAALSVELDVQSTIPFNDQDEDVQVEIVLTLSRMVA